MTPSRIGAIAALLLGTIALAFVAFGGGGGPRYTVLFDNAGGLIRGNLVRVNGINAGVVKDIGTRRTADGTYEAAVEIEVNELGPLREGTFAQLRASSLGGIANRYIALTLAPNNAPALKDGATIGRKNTRGLVGQDEFVNTFDKATREGLQNFVKGSAKIVAGNSDNLRRVAEESPRTLAELRRFVDDLDPGDGELQRLVGNAAALSSALSQHTAQIRSLTANSGEAGAAFAGNGTEISETIGSAPEILDEATLALKELPSTLDELERLILTADRYKTGVPERLRQLATTLNNGEPTLASLARTVNRKGSNNDLADLMAVSVALGAAAKKAEGSIPRGLAAATPLVGKTRAYTPDIVGALTGLGYISANYDAAGHYARVSPLFNLFQLTGTAPNYDLVARSDFNDRLAGLTQTTNRCPGSAGPVPSDGSAPFTDGGKISCNTSDVLPGP